MNAFNNTYSSDYAPDVFYDKFYLQLKFIIFKFKYFKKTQQNQ